MVTNDVLFVGVGDFETFDVNGVFHFEQVPSVGGDVQDGGQRVGQLDRQRLRSVKRQRNDAILAAGVARKCFGSGYSSSSTSSSTSSCTSSCTFSCQHDIQLCFIVLSHCYLDRRRRASEFVCVCVCVCASVCVCVCAPVRVCSSRFMSAYLSPLLLLFFISCSTNTTTIKFEQSSYCLLISRLTTIKLTTIYYPSPTLVLPQPYPSPTNRDAEVGTIMEPHIPKVEVAVQFLRVDLVLQMAVGELESSETQHHRLQQATETCRGEEEEPRGECLRLQVRCIDVIYRRTIDIMFISAQTEKKLGYINVVSKLCKFNRWIICNITEINNAFDIFIINNAFDIFIITNVLF